MQVEVPSLAWYVVHTKPQKEVLAASMMEERLSLPTYLPEVLQKYRGRTQPRPFFPRYVFVQADLDVVEASAINATPGVIRLVSFGERPQSVKAELVAEIRERIRLYNEQGGMPQHRFRPGDRVRLKSGPLAGLEAVFEGPMRPVQRVRIFLEFLGGLHEAEVPIEDLESAPARSHQEARRRGTRGKGRKIYYKDEPPSAEEEQKP